MSAPDPTYLAAIVESSADAIIGASPDRIITSWNGAAERLFGHTAAEAIGQPLAMIAPPAAHARQAAAVARVIGGEVMPAYEATRLRKDGAALSVSVSISPIRDAAGTIIGAGAIVRDVGAAVRERERHERQRQQLITSQRVARVGSWEWDVGTGVVTWSDEMFALCGVERDFEPTLEGYLAQVHPDDRERVAAEIELAVHQRRGFAMEHRTRHDDGSVHVIDARAEVSLGDDLEVVRMHGIAQDITAARALQEELRRQQETLELVAQATKDAVWDWDIPAARVRWNAGLEAFGYDPADVQEPIAWWESLIHPEDAPRVHEGLDALFASAESAWKDEYRFRRKDGSYAQVVDRGLVVRDGSGAPRRMVGSMRDVTEREEARELAKRSAASADLLSRASHELRTPLNAILGFSDLLEQRLEASLDTRERRYLQNIRTSGERLLSLIDRLLQISRASSGTLVLRPRVMTLRALVEPVIGDLSASAAAAGVMLSLAALPDASIRVDLGRIATVLHELVANAIAATSPGGSVTVSAAIPDADLLLEVTDTGRGIPAERRDRVFGVFERLDDDVATSGIGLGLALCRQIVELHGGTITFESQVGRGTTFRVSLLHVAWASSSTDRVLMVEDETNDADLAMSVCLEAGFRCEVVGTIAEARAAILRDTPRAVVLDLHLPDGSGDEILALLGTLGRHVPVAIVSADGEAVADGGDLRLTKPVDPRTLSVWLREVTALEVTA